MDVRKINGQDIYTIHNSNEDNEILAERYNIKPSTVAAIKKQTKKNPWLSKMQAKRITKEHAINILTDVYADTFGKTPDGIKCVDADGLVQFYILPEGIIIQLDEIHLETATKFSTLLLKILMEKKLNIGK
jgi:hypothetical protein